MKKIIIFFCVLILVSMVIQADVYVKGLIHFKGGYRYGVHVHNTDVVCEWWFGKNRVTFCSKGWDFIVDRSTGNTDWRFTLDKNKKKFLAVGLTKKYFIEISLPINKSSDALSDLLKVTKMMKIGGTVTKTKEKKAFGKRECQIYRVSEWLEYEDDRWYARDRTLMVSADVPFNWQLAYELYQMIRSFYTPLQTYCSGLKKIKGFVLAADDTVFNEGYPVKMSFEVIEISQKRPPAHIYENPPAFEKKKIFSYGDIWDIGKKLYVIHYY